MVFGKPLREDEFKPKFHPNYDVNLKRTMLRADVLYQLEYGDEKKDTPEKKEYFLRCESRALIEELDAAKLAIEYWKLQTKLARNTETESKESTKIVNENLKRLSDFGYNQGRYMGD